MAPGSYAPVSTHDADGSSSSAAAAAAPRMATTTVKVGGMTCGACTSSVNAAFKDVDGVRSVDVSLVLERAVIVHDPSKISAEEVVEAIDDRGFDATLLTSDLPEEQGGEDDDEEQDSGFVTTTLKVGGMTCGACTSAVEGAFKNVAGVKSISVSLLSERAVVEHDPSLLTPEKVAEEIEDAGFDAEVLTTEKAQKSPKAGSKQKILTTTVGIEGMTCGACTSAVTSAFDNVEGLIQFNISLLAERAIVTHDPSKLSEDKIVELIEDRGFDATVISSADADTQAGKGRASVQFKLYGLAGPQDAEALEQALKSLNGVESVSVKLNTMRTTVIHKPAVIGVRAIVEAIESNGYNALLADADDNNAQLESLAKTKEIQEWRYAFRFSLCFAIPVFLTSMIFPMIIPILDYGCIPIAHGLWLGDVVCMFLTIPVQFGIGNRFYVSAWNSIKHGSPTMDVLVVLGTSAAFFFSVISMFVSMVTPPHTRPATVFDTSTMLITFISLGRYLENKAKGQTSKALSRLMSLAPSMATIYADPIAAAKIAEGWDMPEKGDDIDTSRGAEEKTIPTELIEVGDVVKNKPGDKIPADGIVLRGESFVEESMVTGEAMPISKKKGSLLMAGTVNGAGRMDFRVTRAGRDTQLSQIVRLVQEAQTSRAPIQRIADMVAGFFVPVIIVLGLATFVAWMILSHVLPNPPAIFTHPASGGRIMVCVKLCISVIVFACPCALGLATPTAIMVGTGVGAQQGMLVKGGAALETATKINHVVLDKTGTLTVGKMQVSRADIQGDFNDSAEKTRLWWTLIGLAEMNSEHPIARAIVLAAKEALGLGPDSGLDGSVGDFNAIVGKGIDAMVEAAISPERKRYPVIIGNATFLRSRGIVVPAGIEEAEARNTLDSIRLEEPITPRTATANQMRHAGVTTIHTAVGTTYTGTISLSDTIKPTARAAILALSRLGIESSIVTGDTISSALVVASQVGIPPSNIHASATPEDKQRIISELTAEGKVVAMVGDGINDSPALASAAVGIALSSGTDVAMEAAGIVLMNSNDLLAIPASLQLSASIFRRIKLNFLWACGYNIIGLPFAMGFFLPFGLHLHPMAAGAAMACSSVSVVASSLALKRWKRPSWMKVEVLDPAMAEFAAEKMEGSLEKANTEPKESIWERIRGALPFGRKTRRGGEAAYVPLRDMGDV